MDKANNAGMEYLDSMNKAIESLKKIRKDDGKTGPR